MESYCSFVIYTCNHNYERIMKERTCRDVKIKKVCKHD